MRQKIISENIKQTQKIARDLLTDILRIHPRQAIVIGLKGKLGSGKTTFVQGFAKALGIKDRIISPTFVVLKKFKIKNLKFKILVHIDAYRIKKPKEMLDLGWKDLMKNSENIVLIEWPENIKKIFPKRHIWINFSHLAAGGAKGHLKGRRIDPTSKISKKFTRGIDIKFVKYYNFGSK